MRKKKSFSSATEYSILTDERETQADIVLRTRISLVLARLEQRVKAARTAAVAEAKINATVRGLYAAKTVGAPAFVMADYTKA